VIPLELKALENALSNNWLGRTIELFPGGNNPCYKTNQKFMNEMLTFIAKKRKHSEKRAKNHLSLSGDNSEYIEQQRSKCDFIITLLL
jgi:hypothetical protein